MGTKCYNPTYTQEVKIPDFTKYNGTTNLRDYIKAYMTEIKGNNLTKTKIEPLVIRKFGETLTKEY